MHPEFYSLIVLSVVGVCLILDIVFIKPKNLKYACKSYLIDGEDDCDDNYTPAPDGNVENNPEAIFMQ